MKTLAILTLAALLAACSATRTPPAIGVGGIWNTEDHQATGGHGGQGSASSGARGGRSAASGGMGHGRT